MSIPNTDNEAVTDRNDPAMINAIRQFAEYEIARNASSRMPALGQEESVETETPAENIKTASHGQDGLTDLSLDAIDNVGNSAIGEVNKTLPGIETFAGLAGAVGQKAYAFGAAMNTGDDLDKLLGPDEEPAEETTVAIEEPEIGVAEPTPEQVAQEAAKGIDLAWKFQMHAVTQAKGGDPRLLEAAGLDQTDIALIDNLPNIANKGEEQGIIA